MEELGLPILTFFSTTCDYDCSQLAEYDCLSAAAAKAITKYLFLDLNVSKDNSVDLKRDFRAFLGAGLEEDIDSIRSQQSKSIQAKERNRSFCYYARGDELWALLEMGKFDIEIPCNEYSFLYRPLGRACIEQDGLLVEKLQALGAKFDYGWLRTFLEHENYIIIIETIIKSGEDLERLCPFHYLCTLLMYCCQHLKVEGVKLLLSAGAKVDATDFSSRTALDYLLDKVCYYENTSNMKDSETRDLIEIIRLLVAAGAPVDEDTLLKVVMKIESSL